MYQPEGFSLEIFKQRYAFTENETWEEACHRVAKQCVIPESPEKQKVYEDKFFEMLVENLFVPGGRIWYNSGRHRPQLLNCFVLGNDLDSKEGWGNVAREAIITSMCGGGIGIDFSEVRPDGAEIQGQRGSCPGPVALMKLTDGLAEPIRAGGQRRVAMMFGLGLSHPNIFEFINAKLKNNELTHANISVISNNTEKFIEAVKSDSDWTLSWKGKYKKTIKAKELWNLIVTNAFNTAEPGFINLELANKESTVYYIKNLIISNPCGEIIMTPYESCCLGHLVLPRFIINNKVDWHLMGNVIRNAVRFLDNVISVNYYPLVEMKDIAQSMRRIGLGTTGLADMLAMLGLRYGSDESIEFIDKLFTFIKKAAYESSVMLAIEKKPFKLCNPKLHANSGFAKRLPKKIRALIEEHGIRNCALLTQAPTGTVSILSGNISAGIEPLYSPCYERRFWKNEERHVELVFHPLFKQFMAEGKSVEHFVGAMELTPEQHLNVQATVQNHIDNAVSKTINMREDFPIEEMSRVWLEYLPKVKGATFYRDNTRGYVDKNGVVHEPPLKAIPLEEAKLRFAAEVKTDVVVNDCPHGVCELK